MKILHINTVDNAGGAARAAYRLHRGLTDIGVDSHMLVAKKNSNSMRIHAPSTKRDKVKIKLNSLSDSVWKYLANVKNRLIFSSNCSPFDVITDEIDNSYDIVNLHWINDGFMRIKDFSRITQPIVWTTCDTWPFTGGCHYFYECRKFENHCENCEQLLGNSRIDLASKIFSEKKKYFPKQMTVIGKSQWVVDNFRKSELFKDYDIRLIHNGIDLDAYHPLDKVFCRGVLGLDNSAKLILFGAVSAISDRRKGFKYLYEAVRRIYEKYPDKTAIKIMIFGADRPEVNAPDFGYDVTYLGRLHDDISLNILYSAADVMVVPSMAETFGNTVLESMACGTPCVAFDYSGPHDIISHLETGYLAKPFESIDLANGIEYVLEDDERRINLEIQARKRAEEKFNVKDKAMIYRDLYEEIIHNKMSVGSNSC